MGVDFVSKRRWFYLLSLAVILPGIVFLIYAPGLKAGIDFTGGSTLSLEFAEPVDQEDIRLELVRIGEPDAIVQKLGGGLFFLRTKELTDDRKNFIVESLETSLSPEGVDVLSFDLVSPVVAGETVRNALYAVLLSAVGIFVYVWWAFRNVPSPFRYGVAAIVALLHDAIIVIGVFAILGKVADMEVNTMFLIALLTVIGYSVNDTIVVFDRLRENVLVFPNRRFTENVNVSIGETLGRSLNTSLTLLFTLSALMLFGGVTLRSFLLVLLIGVVAGTYSSIAIACQVLVSWEEGDVGRLLRRGRSRQVAATSQGRAS